MSIVSHTILRPFGVNPSGPYHRRHAFRRSSVKATNQKESGSSKKPAADESRLEVLYDDGFGAVTMRDYFEAVRVMTKQDHGGPPRWFCPVECGRPEVEKAPLLLFLPGIDGVGMELILHHKSLGRVFEVRCFHVPVNDRTPFEGLLRIVEEYVKYENALSPNRPIYITGDSFGGCLAISVAARNPETDLVLILVNPATSSAKDSLQALLPFLETVPSNLPVTLLIWQWLAFRTFFPLKRLCKSFQTVSRQCYLTFQNWELSHGLKLLCGNLSFSSQVQPMPVLDFTQYKLNGTENLPPKGEADRLFKSVKNCKVRYFRNRGDRLHMEDGFNLLTVIKGANMYRRGRQRDSVMDFLPPTRCEFKRTFSEDFKLYHQLLSPVMLSTMKNGKIVRGLSGVPDKGPVLFVGYHQLLAIELSSLVKGFLREKKTIIRTAAHPVFFAGNYEMLRQELSLFDSFSMYGAAPVSPTNMYKLFERNEFVLMYPGGVREALHRKGEAYKLFWPDQPEFVRMAARFGVTIIPFGCVGEDDFLEIILDYNDEKNIPYLRDGIKSFNEDFTGIRETVKGEDGNQVLHLPAVLPKVPGRLYFLFGKPIEMNGMDNVLKDRENANQVYLQIKSEVESVVSYLKRKRNEDPYRSITRRRFYEATWGPSAQVPTFEP
ncbi:phytyl ester synthase 1, chloroplastic-like isoform X3 [Lolium rigidum]|uniref:phytyl ester synthase 1, chloroplastic-like isoform X3 n=1 Tax=Lolium rigidum TaxID=89674 RepID=UPI001F5CE77F|nr:phytyl ester synthase 1, chloroplastic-like isoform X3 [Lolium rigidum]